MECPLYLAPEHPIHSELSCPSYLCVWQSECHAAAGKENHGLLQSNQTGLHRVRAHEGSEGMLHICIYTRCTCMLIELELLLFTIIFTCTMSLPASMCNGVTPCVLVGIQSHSHEIFSGQGDREQPMWV